MPDSESPPERAYPLKSAKLSKTPSWIMLGFLLGAAFVLALPPLGKKTPPATVTARLEPEPAPAPAKAEPPPFTTIEAVFAEWGQHAVWSDDVTEVALWNSAAGGFANFYEVRRVGGTYYFRTIPSLTRRILTHGKPLPDSPLQFTETEEQYEEWKRHGRSERPVDRIPTRSMRPVVEPETAPPPPTTTKVPPPRLAPPELPLLPPPKPNP